jgi:hypothetical protein
MPFSVFDVLLLLLAGTQAGAQVVDQAGVQTGSRSSAARSIPFDTALAVASSANLAVDLATGGALRILGGQSKVLRVHVTENGRPCVDCVVAVTHTATGVQVRTRRGLPSGVPADLLVEIEVPVQTNVELSSAGGRVEIEGIDGTLRGATQTGALTLRRISGAVELQTRRGDVTLRESYVHGTLRTLEGRVLFEDVGGSVEGESAKGRVIKRRVERAPTRS